MEVVREWMRDRLALRKRLLPVLRRPHQEGSRKGAVACAAIVSRQPLATLNHYGLLQVGKDATASEIRSAYLRLMKERHPDRGGRVSTTTGSAAEINSAYWVLRDPVRRARYDDALEEENRGWLYPRSAEPAPVAPIPSRRSREILAAGALLAVITALVMFGQQQMEERQRAAAAAARLTRPPARIRTPLWLPPELKTLNDSSVAEAAAAATEIPPDEAQEHSKRCFEEVAASPDLKILDYCLAFDTSVALWDPATAAGGDKPSYFNWTVRQARHSEALIPFFKTEKEAEARRLAVEAASVAQLAQKLSQQAGKGQSPARGGGGSRDPTTDKQEAR